MQPEPERRDWTIPVVVGVVVLVVALVVCLGGGAAAYLLTRAEDSAPAAPTASAAPLLPSASPTSAAPSPVPLAPSRCLIGRWKETSYTSSTNLFGVTVQLTGSGTLLEYRGDGVLTTVDKVTRKGTRSGDRYEVVHNGGTQLNYEADDETISYSSPKATGTTTWRVNGSTRDKQQLTATITPERYTCKGDKLRLYGDGYSMEAERILPPGKPV